MSDKEQARVLREWVDHFAEQLRPGADVTLGWMDDRVTPGIMRSHGSRVNVSADRISEAMDASRYLTNPPSGAIKRYWERVR